MNQTGGRSAVGDSREDRSRKRRPTPVATLVEQVLEECGVRDRLDRTLTAGAWEQRVGPHIARISRPARVRGTTLFVEVTNPAWMMELTMMRRSLLRKLNAGRDRGTIEKIVFVQGGGEPTENQPRKS